VNICKNIAVPTAACALDAVPSQRWQIIRATWTLRRQKEAVDCQLFNVCFS